MLKYLGGLLRVVKNGDDDGKSDIKLCLAVTVRTDLFAHSDMARKLNMFPDVGGFTNPKAADHTKMFYGESITCRVKTVERFSQDLFKYIEEGEIFKLKDKKPQVVWIFAPKGMRPINWGVEEEYESISKEEFFNQVEDERNRLQYMY